MDRQQFFHLIDFFGVFVSAISGALMAGRKSMDLFGVLVIAVITGLGGGTLRDVILDRHPVAWIRDDGYILVASLAALTTVLWVRLTHPIPQAGLLLADALALSIFSISGAGIALQQHAPASTAVIMGVMTGVAGGVLRDVLCNEIPLIFQKEVYATACLAGTLVFLLLRKLDLPDGLPALLGAVTVLGIRLAAIRWRLSLPRFHLLDQDRR
jgi:uncharacterized membrane protein YeiH